MQIYLVGGAVRDQLLGRPIKERDYVVVGATEQQMLSKGFVRVGKDFPVFLHPKTKEEYALARTERKSGHGYHGFECHASPEVTLEQDLLRRDLTINAMAMSDDNSIVDPFFGQQDLEQRIFRHVSPAFSEDPLRIFRIARFMARYHQYGFTIAPETTTLMQTMSVEKEVQAISAERIWQETARAIMEPSPFRYFQVLQHVGALTYWFNEWSIIDFSDDQFIRIDNSETALPSTVEQRFAIFACACHNFTNASSDNEISALSKRMKLPKLVHTLATLLISVYTDWLDEPTITATSILEGFDRIDLWRNPQRFEQLLECLQFLKPQHSARLSLISQSATIAQNINVQSIIASGKQGAEIKKALFSQRLAKIQSQIEQPTQ